MIRTKFIIKLVNFSLYNIGRYFKYRYHPSQIIIQIYIDQCAFGFDKIDSSYT